MHMGDMAISFQCFWGLSLFLSLSLYLSHSISTSQVYVVYLGLNKIHDPILTTNHHLQLLSNVFARKEEAEKSMLYSYKRSFSGFSAMLNSTQATTLAEMDGVISVFRSRMVELHTTRSWDFLGLNLASHSSEANPLQLAYGHDVIVAVLDSGIWPESYSFREEPGTGPIPKSWKGQCVSGDKFDPKRACNRKLIGAKYYCKGFERKFGSLSKSEYRSARDFNGHGTHTASTAVGSSVKNASFFGIAQGTARGGAPRARLAVYKVCWSVGMDTKCTEADIIAAFDDALGDGVNVISASFGLPAPFKPFFLSSADIGSFHAMQQGVSVVFSGGNDGPDPSLVGNVAPWSICVAASSIDRTFPTRILVDRNLSFVGQSFVVKPINAELVYAIDYFADGACMCRVCRGRNWNKKTARGKVILCFSTVGSVFVDEAELAAFNASASALIFVEPVNRQVPEVDIIPTILVDIIQGTRMYHYLGLSPKGKVVVVQISPSMTVIKKSPAPAVAMFSSRGPSSLAPDILKPDITAPGINILAAWPCKTPPTTLLPNDPRSVNWNFQSGTSMSCPHVSGVVALLKSAHPDWSPAAIRSALMTTAYTSDTTQDSILYGGIAKPADPFDIGAGHIDPVRAMDPGLVYDLKTTDYILFLCNIGYTISQIKRIVEISPGTIISCPKSFPLTNSNLNYPSITVSNLQSTMTLKRTVRNVGRKKTAIYFASIVEPNGVEVKVWPRVLIFSCFWEEMSYYVTLKPEKHSQGRYDFGEIIWSDGFHSVRSPLVVLVNTSTNRSNTTAAAAEE
ncbi:subtilisin-like protease SBT3.18 isoform X3 [Rhododendron vialii]|uniref:subtilisin-like protease SBT3.18 isoform X3 n=1 Tax=Rhododendron vialii TaxID=182163 RepID=UPI00265E6190|nr:subtilisin-like protease SBT3.18 isoform X3 [Rhododendron vialii]